MVKKREYQGRWNPKRQKPPKEIRMKKIAINLMKCPDCGTIYHWGVEGMGNCPTCRKADKMCKEVLGDLYTPMEEREK